MATDDFFRARLAQMIDLRHPLAVLAQRLPWAQIETTLAPAFAHQPRSGKVLSDCDLRGGPTWLDRKRWVLLISQKYRRHLDA